MTAKLAARQSFPSSAMDWTTAGSSRENTWIPRQEKPPTIMKKLRMVLLPVMFKRKLVRTYAGTSTAPERAVAV